MRSESPRRQPRKIDQPKDVGRPQGVAPTAAFLLCLLVSCRPVRLNVPPTPTPTSNLATQTARSAAPAPREPPDPTPLPESISTPTTPPATPYLTPPAPLTHTVQPGDALLNLAMRYGVPMAAIQLANGMGESTLLRAGQVLSIPPPGDWEEASPFWIVHVVQPGETLGNIGLRYGLAVATIQTVNSLPDANRLRVGQELILPLDGPAAVPAAPTAGPAPAAGPSPAAITTPCPTSPVAPPADVAAWPEEVARLVNEVRHAYGLPPLAYNGALAQAAQGQANDCAQRGWCSHTGADGSDVRTRIQRAGYLAAGWAECWAQSQTPQGAVDMWMDEVSPNDPHRRTLLSTWVQEIGVGMAPARWGYYFLADFGRPP